MVYSIGAACPVRQCAASMRFGLLFATVASLIVHVLVLWLLPQRADISLQLPPSRMQARLVPTQPEQAKPAAPLETAKSSAPPQLDIAPRRNERSPVFTTAMPTTVTITPSGSSQVSEPAANATLSLDTAPKQTAPPDATHRNTPLDLTVRADKTQRRTALQEAVEQQAIRPDSMARSFERVLEQTAPVTTEITQTVDANGNATVKVRTAGGTYCLKNSTPPGATLYDLKTMAGNCPQ